MMMMMMMNVHHQWCFRLRNVQGWCCYYWLQETERYRGVVASDVMQFIKALHFIEELLWKCTNDLFVRKDNWCQGWTLLSSYYTYQSSDGMQLVGSQQACLMFNFSCSSAELVLINWSRSLWAATILKHSQQVACMCTALCQWYHQVTDLLNAHPDLSQIKFYVLTQFRKGIKLCQW
jgi:hypothetical protein